MGSMLHEDLKHNYRGDRRAGLKLWSSQVCCFSGLGWSRLEPSNCRYRIKMSVPHNFKTAQPAVSWQVKGVTDVGDSGQGWALEDLKYEQDREFWGVGLHV